MYGVYLFAGREGLDVDVAVESGEEEGAIVREDDLVGL